MSKYIKLEDAIHNINLEVTGRKEYTGDMKANLFFALDDLPTIDLVRCKDCKWCLAEEGACERIGMVLFADEIENHFCGYGERTEE